MVVQAQLGESLRILQVPLQSWLMTAGAACSLCLEIESE